MLLSSCFLMLGAIVPAVPLPETSKDPASEPVVKNGLQITVKPDKPTYAANTTWDIVVTLKNVSMKPLMLFDADQALQASVHGVTRWPAWSVRPYGNGRQKIPQQGVSRQLKPGEAVEIKLTLGDKVPFFPTHMNDGRQKFLPEGKYAVSVSMNLVANPAPRTAWIHPHWTGYIDSKPTAITVGK